MKFIAVCTQFIVFAHATNTSKEVKTITHRKTVGSILRKSPSCIGDENLIIQQFLSFQMDVFANIDKNDVEQLDACLKDISEMEYNDTNWNQFLIDFEDFLEICREDGPESLRSESESVSRNRRSSEARETIKSTRNTRSYSNLVGVCFGFVGLLLTAFSITLISKQMKRKKPDRYHSEDEQMLDVSSCNQGSIIKFD